MNVNPNMANMNAMGGPVGAPVPMMNNGAVAPQVAGPRQMPVPTESQRTLLNTYIYEYFLRHQMFDCARSLVNGDHQINVTKDGTNRRRDENGNLLGNGLGDDPMDTDSKDDIDAKLPDDLPAPKLPMPASESSFLYEWFCLFWDIFNAQRTKGGNGPVNQYVSHTQQQSRMRQNQQQELLRQMRPDNMAQQQQYHTQMMRNMQNGSMAMNMKQGNLARTAMANNQNNPQAMQMLHQAKNTQMQRDPSDMDGNRQRPSSPGSGENAPSPSKRPRLDGTPYNPSQPGMMPNGRPQQGMPGQQVGTTPNVAQAQQMLITNGINPASLTQQQFTTFSNQPPAVQAKSIATYAANLQQHQAQQMPNKPMPNASGPQGQGSPMMAQGPDQAGLAAYYNAGEMQGGIRPGPGGAQAGGGSNHALQDYQMQLMLLEQQNKKRLMMARQEQDSMGGAMPRGDGPGGPGGPGAPPGPNGQPFPETSPQGARTGASPNPTEQMKRGTPQMNNAGIPSPLPEGAQSRGSPNPMNFMGNQMDPNMAPHFFKGMNNMEGNMVANPQMNGGMRPPSSHPGQPFNGQMNQQQMMAARQQQAAAAQQQQQQGQPPQQQQQQPQQAGQGNQPVQWQGGPNGQMVPQGPQGQVQGTPQQRSMPPPSAPAGANANRTNTSSPQQATAAPPTPSQANKAAPKKKDNKNTKAKAATQKKSNPNLTSGATPAADGAQDPEPPTPATPITPVNTAATFNKNGQNAAVPAVPNGQPSAPAPAAPAQVAPQAHADANQNGSFGIDNTNGMVDFGSMAFADPLVSDNVLNDFDFDSFLHEDGDNQAFDFNTGSFGMEGTNEIGAD